MPIQHELHYIDRQADHEAVDQNLPPSTLIAFARAYAEYYSTGTNNNGKDYRLHATCHFYSAVVIKAFLLHLFFTNRGRRLGAISRFKTINKLGLDPLPYYETEN